MKEKRCSKCGELKELSGFSKHKSASGGLQQNCKECNKMGRHTKNGFITKIYGRQRQSSKDRKMKLPTYTKKEFKNWLYSQENFNILFNQWELSNFSITKTPSVDRIDDYIGYTLKNIQLTTWKENKNKGHIDRLNGINNKVSKAVLQFSMSGKFIKEHYSMGQATRELKNRCNHICECCKGTINSSGGYKWQYKEAV